MIAGNYWISSENSSKSSMRTGLLIIKYNCRINITPRMFVLGKNERYRKRTVIPGRPAARHILLMKRSFTMESKSFQEKRKNVGMKKGRVMKPLYGGSWQVSTLLLCKEGVGKVQWGPQSSLTWLAASSSSDLGIRHHRGAPCASTWALEASLRDPFVVETGRLAAGSLSCNGSKQAVCDIYLSLDHSRSLETYITLKKQLENS